MSDLKIIYPNFEIKTGITKSGWCCDDHKNLFLEISNEYAIGELDADFIKYVEPSQLNRHYDIINEKYNTSMKKLKEDMKNCKELK